MLRRRGVRAALLLLSLSSLAYADSKSSTIESSTIQGITREPQGSPLAQAQVAVHNLDENTDRTVNSGGDGAFLVEDLKPGTTS